MAEFLSSPTFPMRDEAAPSSSLTPAPYCAENDGELDDIFDEDACSICLEPFTFQEPPAVTICRHEYHLQCIIEWSQRSHVCPVCSQTLALQDPSCRELLGAAQSERLSAPRTNPSPAPLTVPEINNEQETDTREQLRRITAASMANLELRINLQNSQNYKFPSTAESRCLNLPSPEADQASRLRTRNSDSPAIEALRRFVKESSERSRPIVTPAPAEAPKKPSPFESWKSKWSTASARCKESLGKDAHGIKEKLLSKNKSLMEMGKGVQREMNRMMERLDLKPKPKREAGGVNSKGKIPLKGSASRD